MTLDYTYHYDVHNIPLHSYCTKHQQQRQTTHPHAMYRTLTLYKMSVTALDYVSSRTQQKV